MRAEYGFVQLRQPFSNQPARILRHFVHIEYFKFFMQIEVVCRAKLLEGITQNMLAVDD